MANYLNPISAARAAWWAEYLPECREAAASRRYHHQRAARPEVAEVTTTNTVVALPAPKVIDLVARAEARKTKLEAQAAKKAAGLAREDAKAYSRALRRMAKQDAVALGKARREAANAQMPEIMADLRAQGQEDLNWMARKAVQAALGKRRVMGVAVPSNSQVVVGTFKPTGKALSAALESTNEFGRRVASVPGYPSEIFVIRCGGADAALLALAKGASMQQLISGLTIMFGGGKGGSTAKAYVCGIENRKGVKAALAAHLSEELEDTDIQDVTDLTKLIGAVSTDKLLSALVLSGVLRANNAPLIVGKPAFPANSNEMWAMRETLNTVVRELGNKLVFGEVEFLLQHKLQKQLTKWATKDFTKPAAVQGVLESLGYIVAPVAGNANQISVKGNKFAPAVRFEFDRKNRRIWVMETDITKAEFKRSVVMLGATPGKGEVTTGLLGVHDAEQVLKVFLAALKLSVGDNTNPRVLQSTLMRLLGKAGTKKGDAASGFAQCRMPAEVELQLDYSVESGYNLSKYELGVVVLKLGDNGHTVLAEGVGNRAPFPRPDLAAVCQWLTRDYGETGWYLEGFQADGICFVPLEELKTGDNPFGAQLIDPNATRVTDSSEIRMGVKTVKHFRHTAMAKAPTKWKGQAIYSGLLEESGVGGQVMMSSSIRRALTLTRYQKVEKVTTFHATETALIEEFVAKGLWRVDPKGGKTVYPGDVLFESGDFELVWEGNGAKRGKVLGAGAYPVRAGEDVTIEVWALVEAEFVGAAKFRELGKGMVQDNEAAECDWTADGSSFEGFVFGGGFNKNAKAMKRFATPVRRVTLRFRQVYDQTGFYRVMAAKPHIKAALSDAGHPNYQVEFLADGRVAVTTIDHDAMLCDVEVGIEVPTVQEAVTEAGMTFPEIGMFGACPDGAAVLEKKLFPKAQRKAEQLAYLATAGTFGNGAPNQRHLEVHGYANPTAPMRLLGEATLDDVDASLRGVELLKEMEEAYPGGVNFVGATFHEVALKAAEVLGDETYARLSSTELVARLQADGSDKAKALIAEVQHTTVWFHPGQILRILGKDPMGRFADVAMKIARCAVDAEYAKQTRRHGLVMVFRHEANRMANSSGRQKVYGEKWGTHAKVVASRAQAWDTCAINANGDVAELLAGQNHCTVSDLNGRWVYLLRYPSSIGMLVKVTFNPNVGHHVLQVNEFQWRDNNGGDFDGDAGVMFLIPDRRVAGIRQYLAAVLKDGDPLLTVFGVRASDPKFGMSGEGPSGLAWKDMLEANVKTQTVRAWAVEFEGSATAGTIITGQAYRLMEAGILMRALRLPMGVQMVLLGGYLYEHHGLAGKKVHPGLAKFLRSWGSGFRTTEGWKYAMGANFNPARADETAGLQQVIGALNLELVKNLTMSSAMNAFMVKGAYTGIDTLVPRTSALLTPFVEAYTALWAMSRKRIHTKEALNALAATIDQAKINAMNAEIEVAVRASVVEGTDEDEIARNVELMGVHNSVLFRLAQLIARPMLTVHRALGGFTHVDDVEATRLSQEEEVEDDQ